MLSHALVDALDTLPMAPDSVGETVSVDGWIHARYTAPIVDKHAMALHVAAQVLSCEEQSALMFADRASTISVRACR